MLLSSKKLHLTTVFSSEGCELLTLSREKFVQLLEIFEDEAVKLYVLARERLYRTNEKMLEALKEIENRFSVSKTVTIPTLSHFDSGSIKDKGRRSSELNIIIQKDSTIKKNLQEKSELDEDVEIMIEKIKNTCKITKKINTLGLKIITSSSCFCDMWSSSNRKFRISGRTIFNILLQSGHFFFLLSPSNLRVE